MAKGIQIFGGVPDASPAVMLPGCAAGTHVRPVRRIVLQRVPVSTDLRNNPGSGRSHQCEHDLKRNLNAEVKLKNWLENNSLRFILEWFDTVKCTAVSTKHRQKRLGSELTAHDHLFLTKLGVLK